MQKNASALEKGIGAKWAIRIKATAPKIVEMTEMD